MDAAHRIVEVEQGNGVGYVPPATLRAIADFASPLKARLAQLLAPRAGECLLDVGCGPGLDTFALAPLVYPGGVVAGVDLDVDMLRHAEALTRHQGDRVGVAHVGGDGTSLPFLDAAFDGCRCERVFQHSCNATALAAELVRVAKPGGRIVVADTDWASLSIDCLDAALERRIVAAVGCYWCNGYAGRQLRRLMTSAGLAIERTEVWPVWWTDLATFRRTSFPSTGAERHLRAMGRVSAMDLLRFDDLLEKADRTGRFFASASLVLIAGRKRIQSRARQYRLSDQSRN